MLDKVKSQFGFSDGLSKFLHSYLIGREQYVEVEGFRSSPFIPTSGVPQGSNLGPLLFNMFINDLVESLTCQKLAYADDLKLFNRIDSYTDCINLQQNINIVSTWCKNNKLSLNVAKCNITSYHRIKNAILYNYTIDDISLKRSDSFKDLGIVFDEKFTFVPHIEQMITSASRMLGFLIRNSKYFSHVTTVKLLYLDLIKV